jgi:histidinol phosphatase-like PHP family hydrolase
VRDDGTLDVDQLSSVLTPEVKLFAFTHISNSLGTINPVAELCAKARALGAVTLVDAAQSIGHMPLDVQELGCEYWAITDHSKSSFQAHGLTAERVREQIRSIRHLNERLSEETSFRLLPGIEVDILKDRLDLEDDVLAELDVVVASLHVAGSDEADNTKRLIEAARNPFVQMLGHITGRLLLEREAYKVNQRAVIDACADTGTWIELNANPYRFDMDWRLWPYAQDYASPLYVIASLVSFVPVLILSVFYLVIWGWRERIQIAPFLAWAAYLTLIHMIFISSLRYRLPLEPFMIMFAAVATVRLVRWLVSRPLRSPIELGRTGRHTP